MKQKEEEQEKPRFMWMGWHATNVWILFNQRLKDTYSLCWITSIICFVLQVSELKAVDYINVSLEEKQAVVVYNSDQVSCHDLAEKIIQN